jgi:hypothetical protein
MKVTPLFQCSTEQRKRKPKQQTKSSFEECLFRAMANKRSKPK